MFSSCQSHSQRSLRRHRIFAAASLSLVWASIGAQQQFIVSAMSTTSTNNNNNKVIDSHLHVWASASQANSGFPYAPGQEPPESLQNKASTDELLQRMTKSGVDGALIVQPINHKFDHSYVLQAIQDHPTKFKGMLLHDPSLSPEEAVSRLEDLTLQGFVGVRFNPYLWPKDDGKFSPMSTPGGAGLAVYKRCAALKMPVGIMCFQGLPLHYDDILQLIHASPDTVLILDHFGFTGLEDNPLAFDQLLSLAKYPHVYVKISALFRLQDKSPNYTRVEKERLVPLLAAFGSERLMFGTDFPFVLEQPESYDGVVQLTSSWLDNNNAHDKQNVMGGTAERVFGPWGSSTSAKTEL